MTGKWKLFGGAAFAALAMAIAAPPARAADYADPGCSLSGSVTAGVLFDGQELDSNAEDDAFDIDWTTPFGEGAGLVTCGTFNIQADVAYHAHSGDFEFDDESDFEEDESRASSHIGGALFYRNPESWAGGVQASWISQAVSSVDLSSFRGGIFGEIYLDDVFTLGASAAYYNRETLFDILDEDGIEIAAYGRYYLTPDFSLQLRGDVLLANVERKDDEADSEDQADFDGFAIAGEAEYLVWDQGLSLFAGARYAERKFDLEDAFAPGEDFEANVDDMQVFGGIKFYFGTGGTLVDRQRSGTIDNTSTFQERLPAFDAAFFLIP